MEHDQIVLGWSLGVVMIVALLLALPAGINSYAAIFGGEKFKYRLDKKRMPLSLWAIIVLAITSFVYAYVVIGQIALALTFCSGITLFGGIGLFIGIAVVPISKEHKNKK